MSFSIFEVYILPLKFFCFSNALKASKVSPSGKITAGQKISKSMFAKNITPNDLARLPETQPNQSSSFSIFVLPMKIFMLQ